MKTNFITFETILLAVLLAPGAYMAIEWTVLPVEIATHFDWEGRPNGWMKKENMALFLVGTSVAIYWLLRYLPTIDPRGNEQTSNYQKLRFVVSCLVSGLMGWLIYKTTHEVSRETFISGVMAFVNLLLAGMGNYLTTVRPNWFVGIRTPWTMESEVVWRKTHRMGGRLLVVGGLVNAVFSLLVPMPYKMDVVLAILFTMISVPVLYSYTCFREEKADQTNAIH